MLHESATALRRDVDARFLLGVYNATYRTSWRPRTMLVRFGWLRPSAGQLLLPADVDSYSLSGVREQARKHAGDVGTGGALEWLFAPRLSHGGACRRATMSGGSGRAFNSRRGGAPSAQEVMRRTGRGLARDLKRAGCFVYRGRKIDETVESVVLEATEAISAEPAPSANPSCPSNSGVVVRTLANC